MEDNTVVHKGRERIRRPPLEDFKELPKEKQENFIRIKEFICNYYSKEIEVCVFGSYKHGIWDEQSDYDVLLSDRPDKTNLDELLLQNLNLKVNVLNFKNHGKLILIP
jgi:predicted nucleotidyltransferase